MYEQPEDLAFPSHSTFVCCILSTLSKQIPFTFVSVWIKFLLLYQNTVADNLGRTEVISLQLQRVSVTRCCCWNCLSWGVQSPSSVNHEGSHASNKHHWSHQRIAAMAVKFQYDLGESKQAVEVCQSDLHMFQSLISVIKHVTSL